MRILHVLSLSLWGGGAVFFSFVAAPRIFSFLRDQVPAEPPPGVHGLTPEFGQRLAGDTVGAIFPWYFAAQVALGAVAVATGLVLVYDRDRFAKVRAALLTLALAVVTAHSLTVYPRSIQVLEAHYRAQEEGSERLATDLRKEFGMWHGLSQTLNLAVIALVLASTTLSASSATPSGLAGQREPS